MSVSQLAAVVLTYNPSTETVGNIIEILKQVQHVFVVNNSFGEMDETIVEELSVLDRITMINVETNSGVATGFNLGMKSAFEENEYKYVILFDQDSRPSDGMCLHLLQAIKAAGSSVGIVGPGLRDRKSKRIFKNSLGSGTIRRQILISSGSLISKGLVQTIGYLEDRLFIDYVDHEYCLRAINAGKVNYQALDVVMDHQFGESNSRVFFGKTVFVPNYSQMRQYYMARNRIILLRKYGFGMWFISDIYYASKAYAKLIMYETHKLDKLFAGIRGFLDGTRM